MHAEQREAPHQLIYSVEFLINLEISLSSTLYWMTDVLLDLVNISSSDLNLEIKFFLDAEEPFYNIKLVRTQIKLV